MARRISRWLGLGWWGLAFGAAAGWPVAAAAAAEVSDAPAWRWTKLAALPDRLGYAGAFAGVSGGALLVAGGANFPERPPWEGGKKVWHDDVYVLEAPGGVWRKVGRLPRVLGYGVSVSTGGGVVCAGGSDATAHYAEVLEMRWDGAQVVFKTLPPLPVPLANAGGALTGSTLYLCGGTPEPDGRASSRFFALDLLAAQPAWRELEPCPGPGRILPVAAAVQGDFYLFSGAALVVEQGQTRRHYLRDAWRYRPGAGWTRLADLPKPCVAAPSPAPVAAGRVWIWGGDDGSLAGFAPMSEHPGFSREIMAFNPQSGGWEKMGEAGVSRVTLPCVKWGDVWVLPSGEVRPGVRSPEVWSARLQKVQGLQEGNGRP